MADMPALAAGLPSVEPGKAPGGFQTVTASPDDFGASIGRSMQTLGAGVQNVAEAGFRVADHFDQIAADDASNQFESRVQSLLYGGEDGEQPGFMALQGAAALEGRPVIQERIKALQNEISGGLKTQQQKDLFGRFAQKYGNQVGAKIGSHTEAQGVTYAKAVNDGRASLAVKSIAASPMDHQAFQDGLSDMVGAYTKNAELTLGAKKGDPVWQSAAAKAVELGLATRISAVAVENPTMAWDMLHIENNRKALGTSWDELAKSVRVRKEQARGAELGALAVAGAESAALAKLPTPKRVETVADAAPSAAQVFQAILEQESGNRDDVGASVQGAVGPAQIMPETFKKYAKEGEAISSPADNRAVGQRIIEDFMERYSNDPERAFVGYFSGPGNVSDAGSDTPWKQDHADGTGKRVSSYVAESMRRLGRGGEVGATDLTQAPKATAIRSIVDDQTLNPTEKNAALKTVYQYFQAKESERIDQEQTRIRAERERKGASESAENSIIQNLTGENPTLTATQIGAMDSLTPDAKLRMLSFARTVTKSEPLARESHGTLLGIMERMALPQEDPMRISSIDQITDEFNAGRLTKADYNFARKQFTNAMTASGQVLEKQRADFFKGVQGLIDSSNPILDKIDVDGRERFYRFQWYVSEQMEKYQKEGKNPWDLLNPGKPDYLGKPETLAPFQTNLEQAQKGFARSLGLGSGRGKKGETAPPQAAGGAPTLPPGIPPNAMYSPSRKEWYVPDGAGGWKAFK